ncbi:MAG: 2-oxoacid:acceptor oxidoreductase family protein, partial [Muribaculaceae bacterium]|nr:2-oxoacid:acceptor oxidoreductase family protein [Muribaculaceae bacterium]
MSKIVPMQKVVVRFSGDSGDGMQLAGNIFTNVSAAVGNQVSTFPDYPAEIRAPQGSLSGVSGFQVSLGKDVYTPGDECDVLVAMNPAALKRNYRSVKRSGLIILDSDSCREADLKKAEYKTLDPIEELGITCDVMQVAITAQTKAALEGTDLDLKSVMKCRNVFALGLMCWLFDRSLDGAKEMLCAKFAKKPAIFEANSKVLDAGYNYGANTHASTATYRVESDNACPGVYTDI